jgi:hypothetical protein
MENYNGLHMDHPILMDDIPVCYAYLRAICSIREGLSFERIGAVQSRLFPELVDKYEIQFNGTKYCDLYMYAYHNECLPVIPEIIHHLNTHADNSIFNGLREKAYYGKADESASSFRSLVDVILLKNNIIKDNEVVWSKFKEDFYNELMQKLDYHYTFENLVMDAWKNMNQTYSASVKVQFIEDFYNQFHHMQLSKYAPDDIQNRNDRLETAYYQIIETINRIQTWLDNDLLRFRVQSELASIPGNFSKIDQCTTPFCAIILTCDTLGRYRIHYGLETNILKMLPENMASTLLRRIYEFTPGAMEVFVDVISFNMDCIKWFEELLEEAKTNERHKVIRVERNEYQSIADMLSQLELKEDVDEKRKWWFRR